MNLALLHALLWRIFWRPPLATFCSLLGINIHEHMQSAIESMRMQIL